MCAPRQDRRCRIIITIAYTTFIIAFIIAFTASSSSPARRVASDPQFHNLIILLSGRDRVRHVHIPHPLPRRVELVARCVRGAARGLRRLVSASGRHEEGGEILAVGEVLWRRRGLARLGHHRLRPRSEPETM